MSILTIYPENNPDHGETLNDYAKIKEVLTALDVEFERWNANCVLAPDADQETVLAAYQKSIDRLNNRYNFQSIDVVSLTPDHPERGALRQKFLSEHTHDDFEVRFFIHGKGLFYLHVDEKVYAVLCEQGDLISVPNGVAHWFDMGEQPNFKCIRLFTIKEGWVANFTESGIAERFPSFDQFVAEHA